MDGSEGQTIHFEETGKTMTFCHQIPSALLICFVIFWQISSTETAEQCFKYYTYSFINQINIGAY